MAFYHLTDSLGREQKAKFISEGNLYRLIVHSKLPSAERFERWVFDEVRPASASMGPTSPGRSCGRSPPRRKPCEALLRPAGKAREERGAASGQSHGSWQVYYDLFIDLRHSTNPRTTANDYFGCAGTNDSSAFCWKSRYVNRAPPAVVIPVTPRAPTMGCKRQINILSNGKRHVHAGNRTRTVLAELRSLIGGGMTALSAAAAGGSALVSSATPCKTVERRR